MRAPTSKGRNEIKYFIEPAMLPAMLDYSRAHIVHDEHALKRPDFRYTIRSLYYDSPNLDFYWEKIDGLKVRRKLRIRTYNTREDNSVAFLEIKRRYGTAVVKERARYSFDEILRLFSSPEKIWLSYKESTDGSLVLGKWIDNIVRWNLEPTMLVVYEREAYVGRFEDENNIRMTFDFDVRIRVADSADQIFAEDNLTYVVSNLCILELKFNHFMPKWMRGLVTEFGLRQRSISKYCMGIDEGIFNN